MQEHRTRTGPDTGELEEPPWDDAPERAGHVDPEDDGVDTDGELDDNESNAWPRSGSAA